MMTCRVALIASLLACLSYWVLAADSTVESKAATKVATPATGSAPAVKPLAITLEDRGKTFTVTVGQTVEVRLDGLRARTGWETAKIHGVLESADDELIPMADASDPAIGTYVFRYKAATAGQATLTFQYITPGGPGITGRDKARRVDQFKVVINVEEQATSAPSQPATAPVIIIQPL
jgi:hypothetical protein